MKKKCILIILGCIFLAVSVNARHHRDNDIRKATDIINLVGAALNLVNPPPVVITQPAPVVITQPAPVVVTRPAPVVVTRPAPVVVTRPAPVVVTKPVRGRRPVILPQPPSRRHTPRKGSSHRSRPSNHGRRR